MADDNKKDSGCTRQTVCLARQKERFVERVVAGRGPARTPVRRLCERAAHEGSGETHRRGPFRGCASRKEGEPRGLVVRVGSAR